MNSAKLLLAGCLLILSVSVLSQSQSADANFHIMRIYGVMAGAYGDGNIQYVELRQAAGGQNVVGGHDICFYNSAGAAYARFTFPSDVGNGASGASILIGTGAATGMGNLDFDEVWSGTPDRTFDTVNTVAAPSSGADPAKPVFPGAGKIRFGDDFSTPPAVCSGTFSIIDSIAYGGAGYTGSVDSGWGTSPDPNTLPTAGAMNLKLDMLSYGVFDNATDYSLVSTNASGGANYPRNNSNVTAPVADPNDLDGDGVVNASDQCPGTAPGATVNPANGCSDAQSDPDGDGVCSPGKPPGAPAGCPNGSNDNCPNSSNMGQANVDGDAFGDACDTEGPTPNTSGVSGGDDCFDTVDNDGDTLVDSAETLCSTSDSDGDGVVNAADNCPFTPNPGQENFDADADGDVCDSDDDNDGTPDAGDADDDNDGVTDVDEAACGGTTPSALRPERIDPPFFMTDDDGDTMDDEALPGGAGNNDCDGDGYSGAQEAAIFSPSIVQDQDACGNNGWAAELNSDTGSEDMVTLSDLGSFFAPTFYFNTDVGTNPGDHRWDLIPGSLSGPHINLQDLGSLLAGPTAMPPMLYGAGVFNGPECPW